jgi:YceI-like protein
MEGSPRATVSGSPRGDAPRVRDDERRATGSHGAGCRRPRGVPAGGERAGFSASAKIKRSDFGLTWNQLLEAGGVAVGDEVKLSLEVELMKQP